MGFDVDSMGVPRDGGVLRAINESISLMKRMGENIDTDKYILFSNNFRQPFIIREGLIKTYPVEKVVKFIGEAFNLEHGNADAENRISSVFNGKPHTFNGKIYTEKNSRGDTETIIIKTYSEIENQEKLDFYMNKYGWFLSRVDDDETKLTYEQKFSSYGTVFQFLLAGIDKMYHVTDGKYLDKILKNGLKPKSVHSKSGYSHEDRIYLFIKKPDNEDMEVSVSQDKVVLEIDLNLLNKTTKIYADPRLENGAYLFEPISPACIGVIEK